jgi:hypothetical protein
MTTDHELREAIAQASWEAVDGYLSGVRWEGVGPWRVAKEHRRADAVLALPEIAALLANELIIARLRALVRERPDSEVPVVELDEIARILEPEE